MVAGDSTFRLDGGFQVGEDNEESGIELPASDYKTVAGFILSHFENAYTAP